MPNQVGTSQVIRFSTKNCVREDCGCQDLERLAAGSLTNGGKIYALTAMITTPNGNGSR